jgi:hypothetical protein
VSAAARARFVENLFATGDENLRRAVDDAPDLEGRFAELRAGTRMMICARMVAEIDKRATEKADLLRRELAALEELNAAAVRWASLAGAWSSIYERERLAAAKSDADEGPW